ncbi:MAG TPA: hypothetical protein VFR31_09975 [Thermoanaerobaculia bacterium]|nr:hypothetical protein [Thermoanaerobaculia bacterium]
MRETRPAPFFLAALFLLLICSALTPARAADCAPCNVAHERCSVNCFGREGKGQIGACLIGCDNAAAVCSCDEVVTLRSEDVVARSGDLRSLTAFSAACHSTTPCGAAYPSCASWSGYANCGDPFCGFARGCGECEDFPCPGPAMKQQRERFRVCFNEIGQSCTEYQSTLITLGCDC